MPKPRKTTAKPKENPPIDLNPGDVERIVDEVETEPIQPIDGLSHPDDIADLEHIALQQTLAGMLLADDHMATVKVYRRDPSQKSGGPFLTEMSPKEWNDKGQIKCIQAFYGKGDYEVRVWGTKRDRETGEEKYGMIARDNISCDEPFEKVKIDPNMPQSNNAEIIIAIQSGNAMIASALKDSLNAIAASMKPQSITEALSAVKMLDEMRPSHNAPVAPATDPFDQFLKFMTLQEKLKSFNPAPVVSGEGGLSDLAAMASIAKDFLPVLRDGLKKADNQTQPQVIEQPRLPANVVPIQQQAQPTPEQQAEEQEAIMFAYMIQRKLKPIVDNAKANLDTKPIAESLLDEIPPLIVDEWLAKPEAEFIELLAQFNPEVKSYQPWFLKLRDDLDALTSDAVPGNTDTSNVKS